jgi:hypothetical protein
MLNDENELIRRVEERVGLELTKLKPRMRPR